MCINLFKSSCEIKFGIMSFNYWKIRSKALLLGKFLIIVIFWGESKSLIIFIIIDKLLFIDKYKLSTHFQWEWRIYKLFSSSNWLRFKNKLKAMMLLEENQL